MNLKSLVLPMLLPGIAIHNDPSDLRPIHRIQMARFDGRCFDGRCFDSRCFNSKCSDSESWALFGDVLGGK